MATDQGLSFNVASVVADVLQQHGARFNDINLTSRKADETSLRRYEAAGWLRKFVGVVGGKDLPAEPSEEEFRLGLRSGIVLCNVINKIQPGAVPKVVEGTCDSAVVPDGAPLSAFQYFENVRNFLVAVEELGIPSFEASDLQQGGKSATARIVNCVLALKSYGEWKEGGEKGVWKYGGNLKPSICGSGKPFMRKTSEPFMNSFSRTSSVGEKSLESALSEQALNGALGHDLNEAGTLRNLNVLLRAVLSDKKPEEIPNIVESMLSKVMEEFERRLASQNELKKTTPKDMKASGPSNSLTSSSGDVEEGECTINEKSKEEAATETKENDCSYPMPDHDEESKTHLLKQHMLVEQQRRDVLELKQTLHTAKAGMQILQVKYREDFNTLGKQLHGLARAASSYQKVLEENRKLYNQVQDLKGNIRVYCRVRPFLNGQSSSYMSTVEQIEEGNITITTPSKYGKEGRKSFSFNKVFGPTATQAEVFSDMQSLIRSVLDGYNVCIFAYGQTGSGKTFTMTGPNELTEASLGVNYRALNDLFLLSYQRRDTVHYDIFVQMLEIYNEQVRDLLVTDGLNKKLEIRNSSQNGINVPDANLVPVSSTYDVIEMMNLGHKNRAVSATAMNDRSSRSHSCLTVHVQGRDVTSGAILRGSMHLVDLAGSERVDKSEVTGDRLKEAQHINKSLSALGDVISSLAQKNAHVPYRNSKLTQLLQDSLGKNPTCSSLQRLLFTCNRFMMYWLQVRNLSASKPRRKSLDPRDLLGTSSPWQTNDTPVPTVKDEGRESSSGDWFEKVMVSKHDLLNRDDNLLGHYEAENKLLYEKFHQNHPRDPSKIYPEQPTSRLTANTKDNQDYDVHRSRCEIVTTDESDLDAAASDCSEPDLLWQCNIPKVSAISSSGASKPKKSHLKAPTKSTETRSLIPSLIPSPPTRKQTNGVSPSLHKPVRQLGLNHGKRKPGHTN